MDVIEQIEDRLSIFKNLYDKIRIVDPIDKKIMEHGSGTLESLSGSCFQYWSKNSFCQNCVSMRAFLTKDTCVRLEYKEDKVFIVIASPVLIGEHTYIVEMLKDISAGCIMDKDFELHNVESFVAEMNDKTITDEITGLYNKRYLSERLPIEMNQCMKNNQPISVVALDIDLFSNVNQLHGYKAGDKILREVAKILLAQSERYKSWTAKYGGDKFMIVLNNYNETDGYSLAEDIRKNIEKANFEWEGDIIKITVSLAVCQLRNIQTNINELLHSVKDEIYAAKSQGKNTTVVKAYN